MNLLKSPLTASAQPTETDCLLGPSNASGNESSYYFLSKTAGTSNSVRDGDGGQVVESVPEGATEDEFAPRQLPPLPRHPSQQARQNSSLSASGGRQSAVGFWGRLFGRKQPRPKPYGEVGTALKLRKAPVKIEPKVFFANERTFLAWMHLSVILAGASIAILAFVEDSNPASQLYGIVLLPVAIAFIVYSMYQYTRRANMIRRRYPGPYEDTVGPTVLGIMLMLSILAQFSLKLYSM